MTMRSRAGIALGAVLLAGSGCSSTGTTPEVSGASTPTTPATSAAAPTRSPPSPSDVEVDKYEDINCENWPQQSAARRRAAAQAALDWLRKHPEILGPEVAVAAPTASQVTTFAARMTTECADRQRSSHLVQLVGVATLVYMEYPEYEPS